MLACTGQQQRWLPPQQGSGGMDMLLGAGYDLQAMPLATDYLAAASALQAHQQRRALVVLVTNVRDEDSEELLAAVRLLQRRHLVCVASLREQVLDATLDATEVTDLDAAVTLGATAHYLQQRAAAHDALRQHGVITLDVAPADLPAALVERYLAVKRDGLL